MKEHFLLVKLKQKRAFRKFRYIAQAYCSGGMPLEQACRSLGVSQNAFLTAINEGAWQRRTIDAVWERNE